MTSETPDAFLGADIIFRKTLVPSIYCLPTQFSRYLLDPYFIKTGGRYTAGSFAVFDWIHFHWNGLWPRMHKETENEDQAQDQIDKFP